MTLRRLVIAITFISLFAMATRVSADTDTWWHLRTGQWIVEHGAIPQTDPFSHTKAGEPWRIPGWIVQVPMYWLFTAFGYAGLNLFTALCITVAFAFVYKACSGNPFVRAFVLVLAAAASGVYWSARPQIVSFLLAGVFVWVLYEFRWRKVNRLWLLPPLMALWANAHGGFALGFILMVMTVGGQLVSLLWRWGGRLLIERQAALKKMWTETETPAGDIGLQGVAWLVGIGLACAVAVMFNPAGPEMLLYPFKTVSIGVLRDYIQEWQAPNFHLIEAQPFLWLLLATLGVAALSKRAINFTDLILVAGVAYTGFLAGRNIALLAVVAPPVLTHQLVGLFEDWWGQRESAGQDSASEYKTLSPRLTNIVNWILFTVILLVGLLKVLLSMPTRINENQMRTILPVGAATFLKDSGLPGPMFNSYNFGAYLTWALYPEYPVYVDGRTDLYDDAFLREYLQISVGRPVYTDVFKRYGIRLVLIESNSVLGDALNHNDEWRVVYSDAVASVYVKK